MSFLKLHLFGIFAVACYTIGIVNLGQAIVHGTPDVAAECGRFTLIVSSWWSGTVAYKACQEASQMLYLERTQSVASEMADSLRRAFANAQSQPSEEDYQ